MLDKPQARRLAKQRQAALSPQVCRDIGRAMLAHLAALPAYRAARTVFCFAGMAGEPDTLPILRQALADGKQLCLPRITGKGNMDAVAVSGLDTLAPGRYGIPQPAGGTVVAPGDIDLALVPCLAATPDGRRLGHGGGYYDRFLARFAGCAVLLCPHALLTDDLPTEPHDIPAAIVLTECGALSAEPV